MAQKILKQLLSPRKTKDQLTPLTVFDLDSTLFCVSFRTQTILREFATTPRFQEKYPEETSALEHVEIRPDDWGIRSALSRMQLKATLDFFEDARSFWSQRFFSNAYLKYDEPYEGAVEFLQALEKLGVEIRYLTGRDRIRMGDGTVESLEHWGFPLKQLDHLIMKPNAYLKDEDYKTKALGLLTAKDSEIYFFENEPLIIHQVRSQMPDVKIIFMESVHSGKADPPTDLPTLKMKFIFE